jgi:2'-5' RNA ligase
VRLFFAVPLSAAARDAVTQVVERVRESVEGVRARWVRLDGLHLTLQFLGATPPEAVPELEAALAGVAAGSAPFEVVLQGAGAFPSSGRPRTLWVGLAAGGVGLSGLAEAIACEPRISPWMPHHPAGPAGADHKPFNPHLTIARTDGVPGAARLARALQAEAATLQAPFMADRVVLYRSILGQGPSRYEPLAESPLGG